MQAEMILPSSVKPPLKWAGGKRWLVPHLLPIWGGHIYHPRLLLCRTTPLASEKRRVGYCFGCVRVRQFARWPSWAGLQYQRGVAVETGHSSSGFTSWFSRLRSA